MILSGDHSRIVGLIDQLAVETRNLIKTCQDIATFSKGGMNYQQALQMSAFERDLAIEGINQRLESASKSPLGNLMMFM